MEDHHSEEHPSSWACRRRKIRQAQALRRGRIAQLGLPLWRDLVNLQLLEYILWEDEEEDPEDPSMIGAAAVSGRFATVATTASSSSSIGAVLLTLERLEIKERLSLLELAVWKAACQLSPPVATLTTPQRSYSALDCTAAALDWHIWFATGWRAVKADVRHPGSSSNNSIAIILTHVHPFLQSPFCVRHTTPRSNNNNDSQAEEDRRTIVD